MQILNAEVQYSGIIFGKTDHEVALPTHNSTHFIQRMAVINAGHGVVCQFAATERAQIILFLQDFIILLRRDSIHIFHS